MITKRALSILSIGEWDYAASGYFLSNAINEHTENRSVAVKWATSPLDFPVGVCKPSDKDFIRMWLQADVVHIHDAYNHIPKGLPDRPTVITWHGSKYRRNPGGNSTHAMKSGWLPTVATVDLMQYDAHNLWMPDSRPYLTSNDRHDVFTVCHAPTSRLVKGTDIVIKACKHAGISLSLIEKKPWRECLAEKSRCHAYVDQFILGYGCNAIEAWMYKQPVIANASDTVIIDKMLDVFGKLPFVMAEPNYKDIASVLVRLRDDSKFYDAMSTAGYEHMIRYHSPEAVAKRAIMYYHKAIDLFFRRTTDRRVSIPQVINSDGEIVSGNALVYLGGNIGKEVIIGPVTDRKYEYSGGKPFLVDDRDIAEMLALTFPAKKVRGKRKGKQPPQPMFRRA